MAEERGILVTSNIYLPSQEKKKTQSKVPCPFMEPPYNPHQAIHLRGESLCFFLLSLSLCVSLSLSSFQLSSSLFNTENEVVSISSHFQLLTEEETSFCFSLSSRTFLFWLTLTSCLPTATLLALALLHL